MNILIRADSSSSIGVGHIMRDLVLAERHPNDSIRFACRDLPGNIIDKIPYPVHRLTSDAPQELIYLIRHQHIDLLIIDHYGIDAQTERILKEATGITLMSVDDTYAPHHCDILLNPNIYADPTRYDSLVPEGCELRCGREFLLVREEFFRLRHHPKGDDAPVLIAMGGSDPLNLSMQILPLLPPGTPVNLVTTQANPRLEELRGYVTEHSDITLHLNTPKMAALMQESRYAILAPSSVAHEAITLGIPFIAVQTAPNQSEFVRYLQDNGYRTMESFDPDTLRTLIAEMETTLLDFTQMDAQTSQKVLEWRNHPDVRSFMYTHHRISHDEHLRFIESLKHRNDKRYFVVYRDTLPIGVVDLVDITPQEAAIGLYVNPETHHQGAGSLLMEALIRYAEQTLSLSRLRAECFSDNPRAKHLYEKFDFSETSRIVRNGREIIILERSHDDRKP